MPSICVIFDLDGTLVDSERLCNQALLDLLPQMGETIDSLVRSNRGKKLATILADIERRFDMTLPPQFEQTYRARVATLFSHDLVTVPGVKEMLETVDTKKCIASSGPPLKIRQALQVTGIADHFGDNIFSSYEVGVWKPDPGLFLHAANALGFASRRCAVVEDSEVGIEAALSAGMRAFQFIADGTITPHSAATPFVEMGHLPELLSHFANET